MSMIVMAVVAKENPGALALTMTGIGEEGGFPPTVVRLNNAEV